MRLAEPGSLSLSTKPDTEDGRTLLYSDRVCSSEETFARVAPVLADYGVTRVARLTGLDRIGVPVWTAIRPNSRSLSVYQGKGITDADARASATMEALERAVAENPPLVQKLASASSLEGRGVPFDLLNGFIAAREQPAPLDHELPWVEAMNILTGVSLLVPYDAVRMDRTRASRYWQSSDGLSSGNTMHEAIFHGMLERIERDADILWKLNSLVTRQASCFDPADLGDAVVNRLVDMVRAADLDLAMFDMTSDIGIPVVSVLLGPADVTTGQPLNYFDVTAGSGAHPKAARAAIRAITEAVQSRLTLISGARDDVATATYQGQLSPAILRDLGTLPQGAAPVDAYPGHPDLVEQISMISDRLRSAGTSAVYSIRLNPGEDRFAVAKILIPELENPEGERRQRYGRRALAKLVRFR